MNTEVKTVIFQKLFSAARALSVPLPYAAKAMHMELRLSVAPVMALEGTASSIS